MNTIELTDTLSPAAAQILEDLASRGFVGASCVADCLNDIATHGSTDSNLMVCAQEIISAAQAVIDALAPKEPTLKWRRRVGRTRVNYWELTLNGFSIGEVSGRYNMWHAPWVAHDHEWGAYGYNPALPGNSMPRAQKPTGLVITTMAEAKQQLWDYAAAKLTELGVSYTV